MTGCRKSCRLDNLNEKRWHVKSPSGLNKGINATTIMKHKHTHALTLRITPLMDSLIADAAYDARMMSKAAWIRLAIARSLRHKQQRQDAVLR